jgi:hypothetical protein
MRILAARQDVHNGGTARFASGKERSLNVTD